VSPQGGVNNALWRACLSEQSAGRAAGLEVVTDEL
jgi:hypothetical protein